MVDLGPSRAITKSQLEVVVIEWGPSMAIIESEIDCSVADILVIPVVLILISFGAVFSQWVRSLEDTCLFGCQEDLFT